MSFAKAALKGLGVAAGVAAGVAVGAAGTAYGAQRAVARNLRHRPDPDAGRLGMLQVDERRVLRAHDGGELPTYCRGSGPTLVFSHGVSISARTWVKQFAELPERGVRVVAYDHRGHGASIAGSTGHSIDNLATDIQTVIDGLDLHDVVLVGHSMGGIAAQAYALHHPDHARARVRGLVLLSTFARTPLAAAGRINGAAMKVTGWLDLAALTGRTELGTLVARLGFGRDPQASHVELARQMLADCGPDTSRAAILPLLGLDLTAELEDLEIPTLVIGGTSDRLTPPLEARRLARHIPGARLHLIERAGHMLMLERTEELHRLLFDFARDVGLPVDALDVPGPLGAVG